MAVPSTWFLSSNIFFLAKTNFLNYLFYARKMLDFCKRNRKNMTKSHFFLF